MANNKKPQNGKKNNNWDSIQNSAKKINDIKDIQGLVDGFYKANLTVSQNDSSIINNDLSQKIKGKIDGIVSVVNGKIVDAIDEAIYKNIDGQIDKISKDIDGQIKQIKFTQNTGNKSGASINNYNFDRINSVLKKTNSTIQRYSNNAPEVLIRPNTFSQFSQDNIPQQLSPEYFQKNNLEPIKGARTKTVKNTGYKRASIPNKAVLEAMALGQVGTFDYETLGDIAKPDGFAATQFAMTWKGKNGTQTRNAILGVSSDARNYYQNLIKKAEKNQSELTNSERRSLLDLMDYKLDIDKKTVTANHKDWDVNTVFTSEIIKQIQAGLDLLSNTKGTNVIDPTKVKKTIEGFYQEAAKDGITFFGSHNLGFDSSVNRHYGIKMPSGGKEFDSLGIARSYLKLGQKNPNTGEIVLDFTASGLKKYFGANNDLINNTTHTAIADVLSEAATNEQLAKMALSMTPIGTSTFVKKGDIGMSGKAFIRPNSKSYKTSATGQILHVDNNSWNNLLMKRDRAYKYGGKYTNSNNDTYALFEDLLTGEKTYYNYNSDEELSQMLSSVFDGNFQGQENFEQKYGKIKDMALSNLFKSGTGYSYLEKIIQLANDSKFKGSSNYQEFFKNLGFSPDSAQFKALQNLYQSLQGLNSNSAKNFALNKIGQNLGFSQYHEFSAKDIDNFIKNNSDNNASSIRLAYNKFFEQYKNNFLGHNRINELKDIFNSMNLSDVDVRNNSSKLYNFNELILSKMNKDGLSSKYSIPNNWENSIAVKNFSEIFDTANQLFPTTSMAITNLYKEYQKMYPNDNNDRGNLSALGTRLKTLGKSEEQVKSLLGNRYKSTTTRQGDNSPYDFAPNSVFKYLETIRATAEANGIGMAVRMEKGRAGAGIKVGFYDAEKSPDSYLTSDNKIDWSKIAYNTYGLTNKDGVLTINGNPVADFLHPFLDNDNIDLETGRPRVSLETAETSQFRYLLGAIKKASFIEKIKGETADRTAAIRQLKAINKNAIDEAPSIGLKSIKDESAKDTNLDGSINPITVSTKSNMFHMREFIKALAENLNIRPDGDGKLSENDITNLTTSAFLINKGNSQLLKNQSDFSWIYSNKNFGEFAKQITNLFEGIDLNLSGLKEESFMNNYLATTSMQSMLPFFEVAPESNRATEQATRFINRGTIEEMRKKQASRNGYKVAINPQLFTSKKGENLGINYDVGQLATFRIAEVNDQEIYDAYQHLYDKYTEEAINALNNDKNFSFRKQNLFKAAKSLHLGIDPKNIKTKEDIENVRKQIDSQMKGSTWSDASIFSNAAMEAMQGTISKQYRIKKEDLNKNVYSVFDGLTDMVDEDNLILDETDQKMKKSIQLSNNIKLAKGTIIKNISYSDGEYSFDTLIPNRTGKSKMGFIGLGSRSVGSIGDNWLSDQLIKQISEDKGFGVNDIAGYVSASKGALKNIAAATAGRISFLANLHRNNNGDVLNPSEDIINAEKTALDKTLVYKNYIKYNDKNKIVRINENKRLDDIIEQLSQNEEIQKQYADMVDENNNPIELKEFLRKIALIEGYSAKHSKTGEIVQSDLTTFGESLIGKDLYRSTLGIKEIPINYLDDAEYFTPIGALSNSDIQNHGKMKIGKIYKEAVKRSHGYAKIYDQNNKKNGYGDYKELEELENSYFNKNAEQKKEALRQYETTENAFLYSFDANHKMSDKAIRIVQGNIDKNLIDPNEPIINLSDISTSMNYTNGAIDIEDYEKSILSMIEKKRRQLATDENGNFNKELYKQYQEAGAYIDLGDFSGLGNNAFVNILGRDNNPMNINRLVIPEIFGNIGKDGVMAPNFFSSLNRIVSLLQDPNRSSSKYTSAVEEYLETLYNSYMNSDGSVNDALYNSKVTHSNGFKAEGQNLVDFYNKKRNGEVNDNTVWINPKDLKQLLSTSIINGNPKSKKNQEVFRQNIKALENNIEAIISIDKNKELEGKYNSIKGNKNTKSLKDYESELVDAIVSTVNDGQGLLFDLGRFPFISGYDISKVRVKTDENVAQGHSVISPGLVRKVNGDFDGDVVWLNNSLMGGKIKSKEDFQKAYSQAAHLEGIDSLISDAVMAVEWNNYQKDLQARGATYNKEKNIYEPNDNMSFADSAYSKDELIAETFASKYNKKAVGFLSNISTGIRNSIMNSGFDETTFGAEKNNKVAINNMFNALLTRGFFSSFEQDAISSKKVGKRIREAVENTLKGQGNVDISEDDIKGNISNSINKLSNLLGFNYSGTDRIGDIFKQVSEMGLFEKTDDGIEVLNNRDTRQAIARLQILGGKNLLKKYGLENYAFDEIRDSKGNLQRFEVNKAGTSGMIPKELIEKAVRDENENIKTSNYGHDLFETAIWAKNSNSKTASSENLVDRAKSVLRTYGRKEDGSPIDFTDTNSIKNATKALDEKKNAILAENQAEAIKIGTSTELASVLGEENATIIAGVNDANNRAVAMNNLAKVTKEANNSITSLGKVTLNTDNGRHDYNTKNGSFNSSNADTVTSLVNSFFKSNFEPNGNWQMAQKALQKFVSGESIINGTNVEDMGLSQFSNTILKNGYNVKNLDPLFKSISKTSFGTTIHKGLEVLNNVLKDADDNLAKALGFEKKEELFSQDSKTLFNRIRGNFANLPKKFSKKLQPLLEEWDKQFSEEENLQMRLYGNDDYINFKDSRIKKRNGNFELDTDNYYSTIDRFRSLIPGFGTKNNYSEDSFGINYNGRNIFGTMDLVTSANGEGAIIDYKTVDEMNPYKLALQMSLYREGILANWETNKKRFVDKDGNPLYKDIEEARAKLKGYVIGGDSNSAYRQEINLFDLDTLTKIIDASRSGQSYYTSSGEINPNLGFILNNPMGQNLELNVNGEKIQKDETFKKYEQAQIYEAQIEELNRRIALNNNILSDERTATDDDQLTILNSSLNTIRKNREKLYSELGIENVDDISTFSNYMRNKYFKNDESFSNEYIDNLRKQARSQARNSDYTGVLSDDEKEYIKNEQEYLRLQAQKRDLERKKQVGDELLNTGFKDSNDLRYFDYNNYIKEYGNVDKDLAAIEQQINLNRKRAEEFSVDKSFIDKVSKETEANKTKILSSEDQGLVEKTGQELKKYKKLINELIDLQLKSKGIEEDKQKIVQKQVELNESLLKIKTNINSIQNEKKREDASNQVFGNKDKNIVGEIETIHNDEKVKQDTGLYGNTAPKEYLNDLRQIHKIQQEIYKLEGAKKKSIPQSDKYNDYTQQIQELYSKQSELKNNGWNFVENEDGTSYLTKKDGTKVIQDAKKTTQFKSQIAMLTEKEQSKENSILASISKKGFFGNLSDSVRNAFQYMIGMSLGYSVINYIKGFFTSTINLTKQLDAVMVDLQIVTGKTREQVKGLMQDYGNLANQLGVTTSEVANSANEWLRMGYNAEDVNTLVTETMKLAKLGMIDSAKATEYMVSAVKGYGVEVQNTSNIVDMATALDMKYAVNAGYILEAMSRTASSAKLAKVSMADLQSMIAIVGETTQKQASVIGESFKTAFSRYGNVKASAFLGNSDMSTLADQYSYESSLSEQENGDGAIASSGVNDIEKVLNKVHISLREKDLKTWRSYSDILKEVGTNWKQYSDYEKNAITTAMFGTRQRENGLVALSNYNRILEAQKIAISSVGTSAQKYEQYQQGIEAANKRVSASFENFSLKISANNGLKVMSELLALIINNIGKVTLGVTALWSVLNIDKALTKFTRMGMFFNNPSKRFFNIISDVKDGKGLNIFKEKLDSGVEKSNNLLESETSKTGKFDQVTTAIEENTNAMRENTNAIKQKRDERSQSGDSSNVNTSVNAINNETSQSVDDVKENKTNSDGISSINNYSNSIIKQRANYLGEVSTKLLKKIELKDLQQNDYSTIQEELLKKKSQTEEVISTNKDMMAAGYSKDLTNVIKLSEKELADINSKLKKVTKKVEGGDFNRDDGTTSQIRYFEGENGQLVPKLVSIDKFGKETAKRNLTPEEISLIQSQQRKENVWGSSLTTIGTMSGMAGGAMLGSGIAKMAGANDLGSSLSGMAGMTVGMVAPGVVSQLVQASSGSMLTGGLAGLGIGLGLAGVGAIISNINKQTEERIQRKTDDLAKSEEKLSTISSTENQDKLKKYDIFARGVNNKGENINLSDADYQDFIQSGNELAKIFPELVVGTDKFGNSLLGVNGVVGNVSKDIDKLVRKAQSSQNQKLLDPELMGKTADNYIKKMKNVDKDSAPLFSTAIFDELRLGRSYTSKEVDALVSEFNKVNGKNYRFSYNLINGQTNYLKSKELPWVAGFQISQLKEFIDNKYIQENQIGNKKKNKERNEFSDIYALPTLQETYGFYNLSDSQQQIALTMAKKIRIDSFKAKHKTRKEEVQDYVSTIQDNIIPFLNSSVISSAIKNITEIDFKDITKSASDQSENFNNNFLKIEKYFNDEKNKTQVDAIKKGMGITTDTNGNMILDGKIITIDEIIKDFLGISNVTDESISKLISIVGKNDSEKVRSLLEDERITASDLTSLLDLTPSQIKNIFKQSGSSSDNVLSFLNKNTNRNNLSSTVAGINSLLGDRDKINITTAESIQNVLDGFMELDNLNLNKDSSISKFLEDLKKKADELGLSLSEVYHGANQLGHLDGNGFTTLTPSQVSSMYEDIETIKTNYQNNGSLTASEIEKLATINPNSVINLANSDPNAFMNSLNQTLASKNLLLERSIGGTVVLNNDKVFTDMVNNSDFTDDIQESIKKTYRNMAIVTSDVNLYKPYVDDNGDISNINGLLQYVGEKQEIKNASNNDYKAVKKYILDQHGIIYEDDQIDDAFKSYLNSFKAIFGVFDNFKSQVFNLAEEINKKVESDKLNDAKKSYKDILKNRENQIWEEKQYQKQLRDFNVQEKDLNRTRRDLNKQERDLDKKESLNKLTDLLERKNLDVERYTQRDKNLSTATELLDSKDYTGKYDLLDQRYENLGETNKKLYDEMSEVLTITPKSAEEAQKLAETYKNLSNQISENVVNLYKLRQEIVQVGIDAISDTVTNLTDELSKQDKLLTDISSILQNNQFGILNSQDMLDIGLFNFDLSTSDIIAPEQNAKEILEKQEEWQKKSIDMNKQYLDLYKTDQEEELANSREDLLASWENYYNQLDDLSYNRSYAEKQRHDQLMDNMYQEIEFFNQYSFILEKYGITKENFLTSDEIKMKDFYDSDKIFSEGLYKGTSNKKTKDSDQQKSKENKKTKSTKKGNTEKKTLSNIDDFKGQTVEDKGDEVPIPALSSGWTDNVNTKGSLSSSVLSALKDSISNAMDEYNSKKSTTDKSYESMKLQKPAIKIQGKNGFGENGLGKRILKEIKNTYSQYINPEQSKIKLDAPTPNEDSWIQFGETISKYISEGIEKGIMDGELQTAQPQSTGSSGFVMPTLLGSKIGNISNDNKDIPTGASVYFTSKNNEYGHVGIYGGDGYIYHNMHGKIKKDTLESLQRTYSDLKYRGWGFNGGIEPSLGLQQQIADVAKNSALYNIIPKDNMCQGWVADVYAAATGKRISAGSATEAGNMWIQGYGTKLSNSNVVTFTKNTALNKLITKTLKLNPYQEEFLNTDNIMYDIATVLQKLGGYSPKAISAILGNIEAESSYRPFVQNSIGAFGLVQWLKGRKANLFKFAKELGEDANSAITQAKFIVYELMNEYPKVNKFLRNDKNSQSDMVDYIMKHYEIPSKKEQKQSISRRQKSANTAYEFLSQFKDGTIGTDTSKFVAGENGYEYGIYPDNTVVKYNEMGIYNNQPKGTKILNHEQSKSFENIKPKIIGKAYQDGTNSYDFDTNDKLIYSITGDKVKYILGPNDAISKEGKLNVNTDIKEIRNILFKINESLSSDLKTIDSTNYFEELLNPNSDFSIENDQLLLQKHNLKIWANKNLTEKEKINQINADYRKYEDFKNDKSNPKYPLYLANKYNEQINDMQEKSNRELRQSLKFVEETLKLRSSSNDYFVRQGANIDEATYVKRFQTDLARKSIPILRNQQSLITEYMNYAKNEWGVSSEQYKNAEQIFNTLKDKIVELNTSITENTNAILDAYKNEADVKKSYSDFTKTLSTALSNVGVIKNPNYSEINKTLDDYLEQNKEDSYKIALEIRSAGLKSGKTLEQVAEDIKHDSRLQQLQSDRLTAISDQVSLIKENADQLIRDIQRNQQILDYKRPNQWNTINEISSYYGSSNSNLKSEISIYRNLLDNTEYLSKEDQQEYQDKINENLSKIKQNVISEQEAIKSYEETIFSAIQEQTNDYIDAINFEKDIVSERYDEEIRKLEQVNNSKQRSIELTEKQQALENAKKDKVQVYRNGIGFVYEQDRKAIKQAQRDLDTWNRNDRKNDLETAKSGELKIFEDATKKWNDYLSSIQKRQDTATRILNHQLLTQITNSQTLSELSAVLTQDATENMIARKRDRKQAYDNKLFDSNYNIYTDSSLMIDRENRKGINPLNQDIKKYTLPIESRDWRTFVKNHAQQNGTIDFKALSEDPNMLAFYGITSAQALAFKEAKDKEMNEYLAKDQHGNYINFDAVARLKDMAQAYENGEYFVNDTGFANADIPYLYQKLMAGEGDNIDFDKITGKDGTFKTFFEYMKDPTKNHSINDWKMYQYAKKYAKGLEANPAEEFLRKSTDDRTGKQYYIHPEANDIQRILDGNIQNTTGYTNEQLSAIRQYKKNLMEIRGEELPVEIKEPVNNGNFNLAEIAGANIESVKELNSNTIYNINGDISLPSVIDPQSFFEGIVTAAERKTSITKVNR